VTLAKPGGPQLQGCLFVFYNIEGNAGKPLTSPRFVCCATPNIERRHAGTNRQLTPLKVVCLFALQHREKARRQTADHWHYGRLNRTSTQVNTGCLFYNIEGNAGKTADPLAPWQAKQNKTSLRSTQESKELTSKGARLSSVGFSPAKVESAG
jgi:hypothetical protein